MNTAKLSIEQVGMACERGEGHFYDRKSAAISPGKLAKALSAFANADGGELFVGIEDDGTWNGLADVEAYNGHVQALEGFFPYGSAFDYEFLEHPEDASVVLHITIQKTADIRFASDGKAYLRRGAQSLPCGDAALRQLELTKGIVSHEAATVKYDPYDIAYSDVTIEFITGVVPDVEPEAWLRKQQMIVEDLPTVAGTVLFNDEPQVHLPKAAVKLYRYTTSDDEGSREQLADQPKTLEGDLYQLIRSAVDETVALVELSPTLDSEGLTSVKYPSETLHEIITNALIHRDFSINDDVHVRVFDNRIEVESPGRLPAHITVENILDERFSRNPRIVRLINKFPDPPNKDVGEGLNTAFAAMRQLDLREPEIEDTGTSVLVLIRHEALAAPESRIVEHIRANGTINNREARELLRRPDAERSIRRLFEKLSEAGEIERVPGTIKGGSRYRIPADRLQADGPSGEDRTD